MSGSGLVVPATGNVTFASNAVSNAVCQVFTPASNRITSLCNVAYNPSTRPPLFVSNFVPVVPGTPLNILFFRGDSKYITAPTTSVAFIQNSELTANLSGGGGNSYYISIGTSAGGSNAMSWRVAVNGTRITGISPQFTAGTNYYISAYASNTSVGTSSIAVSNSTAYGFPAAPTGLTLSITKWNQWSISWTAPAGIAPTSGYTWNLYRTSDSVSAATGTTAQGTTSVNGTAELLPNYPYTFSVFGNRPEGSGATAVSSSVVCPLLAPTQLQYTLQDPFDLDFSGSGAYWFRLSWAASGGSVQYYDVYINDTYLGGTTDLYYDFYRYNTGSWNQFFRLNVIAVARGLYGAWSANSYHGVFTGSGSVTMNLPMASKWRFAISGAGGGGLAPGTAMGIKCRFTSKYSGYQNLYIAQNGRGLYGGAGGGGNAGYGGDMTYFQDWSQPGHYLRVGGGGGSGSTSLGAAYGGGGSCGGDGGGAYQGYEFDYDGNLVFQSASIEGGKSGYNGGAGGCCLSADAGGGYWNGTGSVDGGAASSSTGGNGAAWSSEGGGGGGGWAGGGGGATGAAWSYGGTVRVGSGGGSGSSGVSSHYTEYSTHCGSGGGKGGYFVLGSYDDGT